MMINKQLMQTPCAFQVYCERAEQVKLVITRPTGASRIHSLRPDSERLWKTVLDLTPGAYWYCYHAYDGRSLSYLLPPDAPLDGLKAVLHVDEASKPETRLIRETL